MLLGVYSKGESEHILERQKRALDIHIGQRFRLRGRNFKVFEKYPHFIRVKCGDEVMSLNEGDIITIRCGNGENGEYKEA